MILVVGGSFQGKKAYVTEKLKIHPEELVDGETCPLEMLYTVKGMYHFHEYLKRLMKDDEEPLPELLAKEVLEKNPQIILISNELGYGVVPMDRFDREYREYTGRVCCELARRAKEVHRVVCGIGTVIKDA